MAGNPNPSPATRFKPGQVANPGGKTSAQRKLEIRNAEKAAKLRGELLDALIDAVEKNEGATREDITADILRLLKDSEERGFGAPKQEVDATVATIIRKTNYEPAPDD